LACNEDPRFEQLTESSEIPVDCQFSINRGWGEYGGPKVIFREPIDYFNVELKECPDYISSALGKDGHLYLQHLAMREAGHTAIILVLGGDAQVNDAIYHSLKTQYRGDELSYNMDSYKKRLQDFEAKSFALGIPVMRWQLEPFSRLLSHAAKVLLDGNLMDYRPRPANGEREIVAASCLHRGIGPELMKVLLADYQLAFVPRGIYARPIEDLEGWGPKRCKQIADMVRMIYR
jgi:hypothetical protein